MLRKYDPKHTLLPCVTFEKTLRNILSKQPVSSLRLRGHDSGGNMQRQHQSMRRSLSVRRPIKKHTYGNPPKKKTCRKHIEKQDPILEY